MIAIGLQGEIKQKISLNLKTKKHEQIMHLSERHPKNNRKKRTPIKTNYQQY